jgi:hypothetical protein
MPSQFAETLSEIKTFVQTCTDSFLAKVDRASYISLVDCLKSEDPEAIRIAINQLVKEKRLLAVAPLYLVAKGHVVPWVRQQAEKGLDSLVPRAEIDELVKGKDLKEAVFLLIQHYGHYQK